MNYFYKIDGISLLKEIIYLRMSPSSKIAKLYFFGAVKVKNRTQKKNTLETKIKLFNRDYDEFKLKW